MTKQTDKQQEWAKQYVDNIRKIEEIESMRRSFIDTYNAALSLWNKVTDGWLGGDYSVLPATYNRSDDPSILLDTSIRGKSGLTASEINEWLKQKAGSKDTIILGMGEAFLEAERLSGNRADAIMAHAIHETGWGTSSIVKDKYNWYGIAAFDATPYESAHSYSGPAAGIINGAIWIAENYTSRGQETYKKMRWNNGVHQYATDTEWDIKICDIWANIPKPKRQMADNIVGGGHQNLAGSPIPSGYEVAKVYTNKVIVPKAQRGTYNRTFAELRRRNGNQELIPLNEDKFFNNYQSSQLVAPEFLPVIHLIYEHMKVAGLLINGRMPVNSAFRKTNKGKTDNGAHGWGAAIDIGTKGVQNALQIADICWSLGLRGVAVGGSLDKNLGFVHVDIAPDSSGWNYESYPVYRGPNSWAEYR